jgi:hypothetical protein
MDANVRAAVEDYVLRHRRGHARELAYFRLARLSDEDAISMAALCRLPSGKRHPHQRRIPAASLQASCSRLVASLDVLRRCRTFEELHDLVNHLIRPIHKNGELAVYDTSLRIGARFNLAPDVVYLHRGTRAGARSLGLDWRAATLSMAALLEPFRELSASEAEDVLCIYEAWFAD